MLKQAQLESSRFGLRIFRAEPQRLDARELFREMSAAGVDVAILRVPPRLAGEMRQLSAFGVAVIHADTLVSYECALQEIAEQPESLPEGVSIDVPQETDRSAIDALAAAVFTEYPGHYAANPLLDHAAATAGYCEWALSHLHGANRLMWVARKGARIASIACSTFDAATGECQGVLHGVHPEFVRCGIYRALIKRTQQHFRRLGFKRLTIQTQAWNAPVQRVWAREGFVLADVLETFHINALLDPRHQGTGCVDLRFRDPTVGVVAAEILRVLSSSPGLGGRQQVVSTVAILSAIPAQSACTLRIRTYATARADERILVGTLYAPEERLCALARLEAMGSP